MSNEMIEKSPFEITSFGEAERFAKMMADSDFAPKDYKGKPGNVLIAMQMGHELGLKPMQSIQNIAVVNGRPMVWGDAALALVRGNPECKSVREWLEGSIKEGNAIAYCEVKRKTETITRSFSVAQATKAGLLSKPGTWSQYPERMLQLRARGFALRDAFPDVLKGVYIEGELDSIEAEYDVVEEKETPKLGAAAIIGKIEKKKQEAEVKPEVIDVSAMEVEQDQPAKPEMNVSQFLEDISKAKTDDDINLINDRRREVTFTKEEEQQINKAIYEKKKTFNK